jgi:hypothetical protein
VTQVSRTTSSDPDTPSETTGSGHRAAGGLATLQQEQAGTTAAPRSLGAADFLRAAHADRQRRRGPNRAPMHPAGDAEALSVTVGGHSEHGEANGVAPLGRVPRAVPGE